MDEYNNYPHLNNNEPQDKDMQSPAAPQSPDVPQSSENYTYVNAGTTRENNPYYASNQPTQHQANTQTDANASNQQQQQHSCQQYSTTSGWQQPYTQQSNQGYQWNYGAYANAAEPKPKKKHKGLRVFACILSGAMVLTLVSFASIGIYLNTVGGISVLPAGDTPSSQAEQADTTPTITLQDKPASSGDVISSDGKLETSEIVKKISPSIVAISSYIQTPYATGSGMGSGIVIREDGYIVTNAHVVDSAAGLTVIMSDGTQYEGRVVGVDDKTDLAVIKVEATGLPVAPFGDSEDLDVGEKIITIGTPRSLEYYGSVTQGIVSGLNRSVTASSETKQYSYAGLIQIDAAIYPGNSGGALVNEFGQVVGINCAGDGGEYQGINFAIPSHTVQQVVNDLIAYGHVTGRPMLGIRGITIDEVTARRSGLPTGVRITSTVEGTDMATKGIVPGDIMTKIDDVDITSAASIDKALEDKKPGDSVHLEFFRPAVRMNEESKYYEVDVVLEEATEEVATPERQATQTPAQQPEQQAGPSLEDIINGMFD